MRHDGSRYTTLKKVSKDINEIGHNLSPHGPCVVNKMIKDNQCTPV